ncbi:MAG: YigZ family protein [Lentisphaerae bacterium]|nr:YigZ family protein [Lentisphaerota bacterium]
MKVLTAPTVGEMVVKKSRFIAEAIPVDSPEKAREVWRSQKLKYDNGGHIVFAFAVGSSGGVQGCSDDGEPSGTAGRPMLEVVKNSGITNLIVTAARWYGGIKLGTGGLVRAYTECAQMALENAPVRELQYMSHIDFALPYNFLEVTRKRLNELAFESFDESFAGEVNFSGRLPEANLPELEKFLQDLSKGSIQIKLIDNALE